MDKGVSNLGTTIQHFQLLDDIDHQRKVAQAHYRKFRTKADECATTDPARSLNLLEQAGEYYSEMLKLDAQKERIERTFWSPTNDPFESKQAKRGVIAKLVDFFFR